MTWFQNRTLQAGNDCCSVSLTKHSQQTTLRRINNKHAKQAGQEKESESKTQRPEAEKRCQGRCGRHMSAPTSARAVASRVASRTKLTTHLRKRAAPWFDPACASLSFSRLSTGESHESEGRRFPPVPPARTCATLQYGQIPPCFATSGVPCYKTVKLERLRIVRVPFP